MQTDSIRTTTIILIVALFAGAAVVLLNTGAVPSQAAAATCGGGGGGGGTSSPTGTGTPSPTSTGGGGGLPTIIPTGLPGGGSSSPASTGTPTGSPTSPAGQTVECDSKISIAFDPPGPQEGAKAGFHGKVTSDSNVCIKGRNVIVKRAAAGKDKTVGTTVSNKKGVWKLPVQKAKGKYYAKTPARRVVTSDETVYKCGAAKSKTIRV